MVREHASSHESLGTAVIGVVAAGLILTLAASTNERGRDAAARPSNGTAGSGIDLAAVVETVSHHVAFSRLDPGRLVARDDLYRAEFGRGGVTVSLRGRRFELGTSAVRIGGEAVEWTRAPWRGSFNTATRAITGDLAERVTALDGKLAWEFVLSEAPEGSGPLTIEAEVRAEGAPRRAQGRWRWPVGGGRHVSVGKLVVKDAAGHPLHRALPTTASNGKLARALGAFARRVPVSLSSQGAARSEGLCRVDSVGTLSAAMLRLG